MKKENWRKAFGNIPEDYHHKLNSTLNGLTEAPERRIIRKPVLMLAAALVLMLGIAAAAGTTHLFNVFGKTPLEGAEDGIVKHAGASVEINDDITAEIDHTYYDGSSIYYEMTLTLSEPDKYRIFCEDQGLYLNFYEPTGEFTALDVTSRLFDHFEITNEFGEEYEPTSGSFDQYIEHIEGGVYKLYGSYYYENPNGLTLPDTLDLDVSLDIRYDPTVDDFHLIEPVKAEIPFHVVKSAVSTVYNLTPISQPDGWTITSASYEQSLVSGTFEFNYNFGKRFDDAWDMTFGENASEVDMLYADELLNSNLYSFYVLDPVTNERIKALGRGGDIEMCEFFRAYIEVPAFEDVPETISVHVVQQKLIDWSFGGYDEEGAMIGMPVYEDVDLGVIEFNISPAN